MLKIVCFDESIFLMRNFRKGQFEYRDRKKCAVLNEEIFATFRTYNNTACITYFERLYISEIVLKLK